MPAAELGAEIWSYGGSPENAPEGTLFLDHRRLAHIVALLRRGRRAHITDSTHFHLEYPHWVLLPLWIAAKRILDFRWTKIIHDGSLPARLSDFTFVQRFFFRKALGLIDEIVTVDEGLLRFIKASGYKGRLRCVPSLLPGEQSIDRGEPPQNLSDTIRRLTKRKRTVCSVGAFIPSYGFDQVAAAVEMIRTRDGLDIGLLLIDAAFARDDDYQRSVLSGREWIECVEGVPPAEVHYLMSSCDAFVRAFEHESLGLSRIEAIWCGLPVIATDAGETRGMLTYRYGDIPALTQHLRNVLDGGAKLDAAAYAEMFRKEAQANLESFLRVICE